MKKIVIKKKKNVCPEPSCTGETRKMSDREILAAYRGLRICKKTKIIIS